jgi:hypothetical protein
MNWYLAKMVYQIICGDGKHPAQFDEQLRLVNASDYSDAFCKSREIGVNEEDNFLNYVNKPVRWKFIDVSEIYFLDKLVDGAEVYSRIHEEDNAEKYIRSIEARAAYLVETAAERSLALN